MSYKVKFGSEGPNVTFYYSEQGRKNEHLTMIVDTKQARSYAVIP